MNKYNTYTTVQSIARAARTAASLLLVATLVGCNKEDTSAPHASEAITGAATVATSGSGILSRAANDITDLSMHYRAIGAADGEIITRPVANTGTHAAISFNTITVGEDPSDTDNLLYWKQIEKGSASTPEAIYLTTNRESADCFTATNTPANEALWANYPSNGSCPSPVPFGEMKCRMAKFSVVLTTSAPINPAHLEVYTNLAEADLDNIDITQLAIPAMLPATATKTTLIPPPTSPTSEQETVFKSTPILLAQQAGNDITVWYDKNDDKEASADELFTIAASTISVDRGTDPNTFEFYANEHITLNIKFGIGTDIGAIGTISVTEWTLGDGWEADGTPTTE